MSGFDLFAWLALVQGGYYVITGIWPLVSIETFQRVTGPKTDLWLVKTVGVLVAVVGATLLLAGFRRELTQETLVLATGTALGLAVIETVYVLKGRISPIYLLDVAAEALLIAGWSLVLVKYFL